MHSLSLHVTEWETILRSDIVYIARLHTCAAAGASELHNKRAQILRITKFSSKGLKSSTKPHTKKINEKKSSDDDFCMCMTKFISFVLVIFGLTYMYQARFVYKNNSFYKDGVGDISVRHFARDLNSIMCRSYEVTSWKPADIYLVTGKARINNHKHNILKRRSSDLFPGYFDSDNEFYLLEGSHIKVNACKIRETFDPHVDKVEILLFKGDYSWDQWKNGKCNDCPIKRKTLSDIYCEDGGQTHLEYIVEERDSYVVAVTKKNDNTVSFLNVMAELEVIQTTFDTRHAQQICHQTTDCVLNLTYSVDVDVVMKFSNISAFSSFTTECHFRVMFWVAIFAILSGCLIGLAFLCCGCIACCERADKKETTNKQSEYIETISTNDKYNLVKNELPPCYNSVVNAGSIQVV